MAFRRGQRVTFLLGSALTSPRLLGNKHWRLQNCPLNYGKTRVQVLVRDNNVDQALKALKKKMQREGIFREMKLRGHYEKPSEKRVREEAEAVRRARKLTRKKLQREGLLPAPKPKVFAR